MKIKYLLKIKRIKNKCLDFLKNKNQIDLYIMNIQKEE